MEDPQLCSYYDWHHLLNILFHAIDLHMEQWYHVQVMEDDSLKTVYNSLHEELNRFPSAPFTIQRLSELACQPPQYYRQPLKYLRAIERCVKVWSSQTHFGDLSPTLKDQESVAENKFFKELSIAMHTQEDPLLVEMNLDGLDEYAKQFSLNREHNLTNPSFERSFDTNDLFTSTLLDDKSSTMFITTSETSP
jgi:hypothetical protein